MRRLGSFHFVTLDGHHATVDGDTSWHPHDPESAKFAEESMRPGGTLVFGRHTYEMMSGFWPTPVAKQQLPAVAAGMNDADKLVFSRTLTKADWSGTTLVREDAVTAMKRLKTGPGGDLTVLGSATLFRALLAAGLVDEVQLLVDPLVLGRGRPLFDGVPGPLPLRLEESRRFANGSVLLRYAPG